MASLDDNEVKVLFEAPNFAVISTKNPDGTATRADDDDDDDDHDAHIDRLAKTYVDQDTYPFRQPGEERVTYVISPDHVRHTKQ